MGVTTVQSNLTGGELAPELHARIDIEKYATSVADAENVIIVPQGGLRRRPGLSKITDGTVGEDARLEPFVFNKTQQYLIVFRAGFIDVLRDGTAVKTGLVSPFTTMTDVDELDVIQSADTVIITHEDYAPQKLVRGATDADWTISAIDLEIPLFNYAGINYLYENRGDSQTVNIKIDDIVWNYDGDATNGTNNNFYKSKLDRTGIDLSTEDFTNTTNWEDLLEGKEEVWSATRGWPISCAFHKGRLWFGGSTSKPTSVWGSKINAPFDFVATPLSGTIPDDHAIFDTIESDRYNKITNIFSGRSLQVFTTGQEYINKTEIPTPADSAWEAQTGYGSKGVRPIFIDGATLFIDSSERTIREFVYNFDEDGYVSNSITLLASHLLTDIKSIGAIKGTDIDVSDFVYAVNSDGTLAVMNTLRSEGILGWTHWTTDGEFLDVCVVDKVVYFLVKREGEYFIEVLNEDSYTDHNVVLAGTEPDTFNVVSGVDNVVFGGDNVIFTDFSTGTPVTSITTDFDAVFDTTFFKVIADYSMQDDAQPTVTAPGENTFSITREAYRLEVGLDFSTRILTLPLNTTTRAGSTLHRRKRITKAEINVYESLGVYVRDIYSGDRKFTVSLDSAPTPYTGFKELYLLGYNKLTQLEVTQENPLPMLVRAIGYEVEY